MPRVLVLHELCLAGMPWRIERAVNLFCEGWEAVRCQQRDAGYGFPQAPHKWGELPDLLRSVDLVHVHHIGVYHRARKLLPPDMPVVVTVHGLPDVPGQRDPGEQVQLTTVNPKHLALYPRAYFVPNFSVEADLPFRRRERAADRLTILRPPGHAWKQHGQFAELRKRFSGTFRWDVATSTLPNPKLLERMAGADMVWDFLDGYFSCTVMEAWGVGALPIFSGSITHYHGDEPTYDDLGATLARIADDPQHFLDLRDEFRQYWDQMFRADRTVKLYQEVYDNALALA